MKFKLRIVSSFWQVLRETIDQWDRDNVVRLAAALAFYMVFSLAPMLLIVLAVAGAFAGRPAAKTELFFQIGRFVGPRAAGSLRLIVEGAAAEHSGHIAAVIALAVALFGATAVFVELQGALNYIWGVQPKPGQYLMRQIRTRLLSFVIVLCVGLVVLLAYVAGTILSTAQHFIGDSFPISATAIETLSLLTSFVMMTVLCAAIYKILPDVEISWRDVWTGAIMTALLLAVGKSLITLYLARSTLRSVYGAAGSLVMILLWVYYAAQIFLFGAEFTQVYARHFGSVIRPSRGAVWRQSRETSTDQTG